MSCPSWCPTTGEHILHYRVVGEQGDMVSLLQVGERPTEVIIYGPNEVGGPLTPGVARILGQALVAGGQDAALGELLLQAAGLAEGGGHAADALSDAQLDGTACVRCGATEGPMVPAGRGGRGQLFECSHHRRAGGEA